ncbi:MAG: hypothetical protein Q7S95_04425 [bacterium]|nr:hypothetical protein [bacterium]
MTHFRGFGVLASILLVAVVLVIAFLGISIFSSHPQDTNGPKTFATSTPSGTQYLVFGIPADVYDPGKDVHDNLDKLVTSLINRFDTTGDAKHRLGFMIVLPVLFADSRMGGDQAHIEKIIKEAFIEAKERNVAVYFTLYSFTHWPAQMWNWYDPAQPGYNFENKKNVEWTDWSGTPVKARYSIQEGEIRMAPVMCYNSPKVLSEVSYITSKVLGPALLRGVSDLKSAGKEDLFGGITLSEELSLDNYSGIDKLNPKLGAMMTTDGALKTRLGYCALTNLGYSKDKPPADFADALAKVNQDYAAYWGKQLTQAGVPKSKLYTHVAPATDAAYLQYTNAPIETAFNDYSNPGWTTYLAGPLAGGFDILYKALAANGHSTWGSTESSPTNVGGGAVKPETYLAWHYNHGATLIVMNAADTSAGGQAIGKSMWSSAAIAAYKKFLSGKLLQE